MKKHHYKTNLLWKGNEGVGTESYRSYSRNHSVHVEGKEHKILGSSDPSFRGDKNRYNPEELFLASLSTCHMLWYLHLCSVNKVIVTSYQDEATGIMQEDEQGGGKFTEVVLYPKVGVENQSMLERANELHEEANRMCFIANSCNFKIKHQPISNVKHAEIDKEN